MTAEEIEKIKEQMDSIKENLLKTTKQLNIAIDVKNRLSDKIYLLKQNYSNLDRQLAMIDGRFSKIQSEEKKKEERKTFRSEFLSIANKFSQKEREEFISYANKLNAKPEEALNFD